MKNRRIIISDTTLRDGEQAPGVAFTLAEKLKFARLLDETGVDEIEAGVPVMGKEDRQGIRKIVGLNLSAAINCWCRGTIGDLELASRCNTGRVHFSFPVSSQLMSVVGRREEDILGDVQKLVALAGRRFDFVSVGAMDASRADISFLKRFTRCCEDSGAGRIRLADTVGILSPHSVTRLVGEVRSQAGQMEIEFHGHNDLGMATGNTVAAAEAGADVLSVTTSGIGERAGNAALEEVAAALRFGTTFQTRVKLERLGGLCAYLEKISGITQRENKPVTGSAIFTHESGIHAHALIRDRLSFQPFFPEDVGREESRIVAGKHSGSSALAHILEGEGIGTDRACLERILPRVRAASEKLKRSLTPSEVKSIYATM